MPGQAGACETQEDAGVGAGTAGEMSQPILSCSMASPAVLWQADGTY